MAPLLNFLDDLSDLTFLCSSTAFTVWLQLVFYGCHWRFHRLDFGSWSHLKRDTDRKLPNSSLHVLINNLWLVITISKIQTSSRLSYIGRLAGIRRGLIFICDFLFNIKQTIVLSRRLLFDIKLSRRSRSNQTLHLHFIAVGSLSIEAALNLVRVEWLTVGGNRHMWIILDTSNIHVALVVLIIIRYHFAVQFFLNFFRQLLYDLVELHFHQSLVKFDLVMLIHRLV